MIRKIGVLGLKVFGGIAVLLMAILIGIHTPWFLDFAGSGIVHMAGAAAALAGVLLVGARKGKYGANGQVNAFPGANLPLATLGTFILWLGWFGFNGGSVLATASVESANAVAVVFMNTNAAAAGGCIAALLVAKVLFGKADLTMALNGCLAGLVAITAGRYAFGIAGYFIWGFGRGAGCVLDHYPRQAED